MLKIWTMFSSIIARGNDRPGWNPFTYPPWYITSITAHHIKWGTNITLLCKACTQHKTHEKKREKMSSSHHQLLIFQIRNTPWEGPHAWKLYKTLWVQPTSLPTTTSQAEALHCNVPRNVWPNTSMPSLNNAFVNNIPYILVDHDNTNGVLANHIIWAAAQVSSLRFFLSLFLFFLVFYLHATHSTTNHQNYFEHFS